VDFRAADTQRAGTENDGKTASNAPGHDAQQLFGSFHKMLTPGLGVITLNYMLLPA
jgi:hypothetical protein